jgi:hypothetical protein
MSRIMLMLLVAAMLTSCARPAGPDEWQKMQPAKKRLYVSQLLGHEQSKQSKGGNQLIFRRSVDQYTRQIDEAYAKGDSRSADAIFHSYGEPR